MKKFLLIFLITFFSCQHTSELSNDFSCSNSALASLEETIDMKKKFTVSFPKKWKVNLYYDAIQSSIYTADTTKQLTETTLLDITYIKKSIVLNDLFKLKNEEEHLVKGLVQIKSNTLNIFNKPSYYALSRGQKKSYPYQVCNIFTPIDSNGFVLSKIEVYGDSLVEKRICEAIYLIDKIVIH